MLYYVRSIYEGGDIMSEQLRQAYEKAQKLPESVQNTIAARILEEIEEAEWDAIVSKPRVQRRLRELTEAALREHEAGQTREGGFGDE